MNDDALLRQLAELQQENERLKKLLRLTKIESEPAAGTQTSRHPDRETAGQRPFSGQEKGLGVCAEAPETPQTDPGGAVMRSPVTTRSHGSKRSSIGATVSRP